MPTTEKPKLFAERYLPVRRLGKGGMGLVALALDTLKGNLPVALKFVCEELADDTRAIADLTREVVNSQKLSHPNILRVYELMKYKDTYFITMEYVAGEDLNKRLGRYQQQGHNFSLEEVLECARQICSALDYAHDQKVLHLDIKPSNIICDERGNYKLMDFGIARSAHESMTRVTKALGYTGGYASPEQVRGRALDRRTDVYNLAATFYDLLAGKVPCSTEDAIKNEIPDSIPGLPSQINETLLAGLAKDPEERPKTAGMLLEMLEGKSEQSAMIEHRKVIPYQPGMDYPVPPVVTPTPPNQLQQTPIPFQGAYCPLCGDYIDKRETFHCSKCGREGLCLKHLKNGMCEACLSNKSHALMKLSKIKYVKTVFIIGLCLSIIGMIALSLSDFNTCCIGWMDCNLLYILILVLILVDSLNTFYINRYLCRISLFVYICILFLLPVIILYINNSINLWSRNLWSKEILYALNEGRITEEGWNKSFAHIGYVIFISSFIALGIIICIIGSIINLHRLNIVKSLAKWTEI